MADILIWAAVAVAVIAVWLLAGRFTGRGRPSDGIYRSEPYSDTYSDPVRSDPMRGGMF